MMTPLVKFLSLLRPSQCLNPGVTIKKLNAFAAKITDNEAAEQMDSARDNLFKQLHERLALRVLEYTYVSPDDDQPPMPKKGAPV